MTANGQHPENAGPTVLLVEDDPLIMFVTAEMLSELGCAIIEATDFPTALAALQSETIDVLITDVNLRGSSGIDVAVVARKHKPGIGVIFASGERAFSSLDAPGPPPCFLAKPYGAHELREALRKIGAITKFPGSIPLSSAAL